MNSAIAMRMTLALVPTTLPTLLPAEPDVGLVDIEQASVGDSDPMGVAREIGQELRGTGEGLFGVEDPCDRRSSGKENGNVT
jgi:hypothetical protein